MWAAMILFCKIGTTECYNRVYEIPLPSEKACQEEVYKGAAYFDSLGFDVKNYTCYKWDTPT